MRKDITAETLAATLLIHGTVKDTAAALKIPPRTLYDRFRDEEFKEIYRHAQADIFEKAFNACVDSLTSAVKTVTAIMNDKKVNPQTRLQAAQTILNKCVVLYEIKDRMRAQAEKDGKPKLFDLF